MKKPGRVSVSRAARLVGVHYNTMLRHAHKALDEEPALVQDVQQDPQNKYITVALDEVLLLRSTKKSVW